MTDDPELDPGWYTLSRFRPGEVDLDTLLALLKHDRWEVRFNAARELRFQPDGRALPGLLAAFKQEKHESVRGMLANALSALHEAGIDVPLFAGARNPDTETRRKLAIRRLKELRVRVYVNEEYYHILVPHKLRSPAYIEIGYLMAQLVEEPFLTPIEEDVPSTVLPTSLEPQVEFVDSHPHGLKFRIYLKLRAKQKP